MINEFKGRYRFLSNFYDQQLWVAGGLFKTAEHAFQAAKTNIPEEMEEIREAYTPGQAKRLGRKVTLRPDWEDIKIKTMEYVVVSKFWPTEMRLLLLATGDQELVEGNTWGDTFWGVCNGEGRNELGKTLIRVREHYQEVTLNNESTTGLWYARTQETNNIFGSSE